MIALPIDPHLPGIVERVRRGPGLVLVAEPGAGKTTRVPRALLEGGLADGGEILVLEPRRIATRMAARRVAQELGEEPGQRVGYTVRFESVGSARTKLRFITEGVLTRRLIDDPLLRGVSVVVLDEFHERSLHADLALAMCRHLQRHERPDLRIVAMSATMNADQVSAFLDAPSVSVPGRPFDVALEYAELGDDRPLERRVAAAVKRALNEESQGHVLVFLPGAAEIRRAAEALTGLKSALVLPLHGDLPPAEQDRAVAPSKERKVLLSTNVAETSLTIDGVVAVVDSGLARVARHSPWSGLPTLELAPICQASATQRAGRAGRTRAGRALRLYTEHDFKTRPAHDEPEILRVDLAETLLALHARGVGDPRRFPFFEAPREAALEAAQTLLAQLGAVDAGGLTELGRRMLALPLHPRLARTLLEAERHGAGDRAATLVAVLGERDLRLSSRTSFGRGGPAASVEVGDSDALARLEAFESVSQTGNISASRLRAHGLDVSAGLAVHKNAERLRRALRALPALPTKHADLDADDVLRRALLAGYPDRVAKRRRANSPEVVLAGGGSAKLAESSVVRDADLMITVEAEERRGSVEVRVASAIDAEWLLEDYEDLVEDLSEVRFDASRGRIERISGLRYLGLMIDESRGDAAGTPGAAAVLARAAMTAGLQRFLDVDALTQLQRRVSAAASVDPKVGLLDDARIERVLTELCEGRRSLDELANAKLLAYLEADLGHDVMSRVERLAPTTVALPGRKVKVHYEVDRPAWIESRMQDFFGLREGPKVGNEALVLHLLAPNQRAVQVTTDLAGFWERHYPALRKELMRRYPRHRWPEDPLSAS